MASSSDAAQRREAADILSKRFGQLKDKEAAWKDLHKLIWDQNRIVRGMAADALGATFPYVSDKDAAWVNLHRLTADQNRTVRGRGAGALGGCFPQYSRQKGSLDGSA